MDHDILLLGASAGGVDALSTLCRGLPPDLPAAVLVVQHVAPTVRSLMPDILSRAGVLPAAHARDSEPMVPGRIFIAPPDHHLLVNLDGRRLMLRRGPQENRVRPAIDALFRSAAVACGPRVVAAVLTGTLDDGTAGLVAVKACGGISVVQDPADAAWPDMPRNALQGDSPDHCVPLAGMALLFARLARSPAPARGPVPSRLLAEARVAEREVSAMVEGAEPLGKPSPLSCPGCGGVLNRIEDGRQPRFRCQIGHAYGAETLAAAQAEALEQALATAVRTHRERQTLFRQMATQAEAQGLAHAAAPPPRRSTPRR